MISWRDYRSVTDRVAATCIEAVKFYAAQRDGIVSRRRADAIQQLVLRLARQAGRQGIEPEDINRANDPMGYVETVAQAKSVLRQPYGRGDGLLALEAIASAIFTASALKEIDFVMGPLDETIRTRLPDAWRHVAQATARILDRAVAAKFADL